MRWVTPESRSKLMPGAQLPRSNCCFEQGRPLVSCRRLPFSSTTGPPMPPPPPRPHMPERSGWPSAVRGVVALAGLRWLPAGAVCAEGDTKPTAAAKAAAMANRFSWFMKLKVVRVVRVFVIHRHGAAVLERESDDAHRARTRARRRVADLQRLADREDARHA